MTLEEGIKTIANHVWASLGEDGLADAISEAVGNVADGRGNILTDDELDRLEQDLVREALRYLVNDEVRWA